MVYTCMSTSCLQRIKLALIICYELISNAFDLCYFVNIYVYVYIQKTLFNIKLQEINAVYYITYIKLNAFKQFLFLLETSGSQWLHTI